MLRILAAMILLLVNASCSSVGVGIGGASGGVAAGAALPASSSRSEARALLDRINRHRVAIGCRALIWDDRLAAVARRHSEDMARRGFFSHTNPDGRDPFDRLKAAGIRYRAAAENIAEGQRLARETYDDWIESQGHRENIENCRYTRAGVGVHDRYWTLDLVREIE